MFFNILSSNWISLFLTISSIGVTFTGISTVTTLPFGNVIVTFTGSFLPGVVKSGMFSTLVVAPSGTLICFKYPLESI